MSTSNSPCAACKCLRRKCTQECVFAPYFPPDNPQKFTNVHKVFGASNVSKLLNELNVANREDAVNSLAFEAEYRLRDPVYGCVGPISVLQHKLKQIHQDLDTARKELATYIGPSAMLPILNHPGFMQQQQQQSNYHVMPYNLQQQPMGMPTRGGQLVIGEPQQQQQQQQQQYMDAEQIVAAAQAVAREQEMMRNYEQQQQNELMRYNSGGFEEGGSSVTATGFNQMGMQQQPSLALGTSYEAIPYHHIQVQQQQEQAHLHPHQLHIQQQHLLQHQQQNAPTSHQPEPQQFFQTRASHTQQQPPQATSEEDRSLDPPSS